MLTRETPQSGSDRASHGREALEIIDSWNEDPFFALVRPHLNTIRKRYTNFVGQTQAGTGKSCLDIRDGTRAVSSTAPSVAFFFAQHCRI